MTVIGTSKARSPTFGDFGFPTFTALAGTLSELASEAAIAFCDAFDRRMPVAPAKSLPACSVVEPSSTSERT